MTSYGDAKQQMSDYERIAWEQLRLLVAERMDKKDRIPARVRGSMDNAGDKARDAWDKVPGNDDLEEALVKARVTAHVGTYYGYEVSTPEEDFFALSAMSFSNSGPQAAKLMAFQQLSTVTQPLVRRKAWEELNEKVIVKVITEIFERLGLVIT